MKTGIGLTIAGTILTALGTAIIIINNNTPDRVVYGGVSRGHRFEYDIIGGFLIAGGLGMLIPGITLLLK